MADLALLDRAHAAIMRRMIATGQAPFYTELAAELGLSVEEGRRLVHETAEAIPGWVHPGTDYIVSFAPFHNLPTQYRVSVDGEQKWFAQCGFEALAVRWLFPGQTVRIEAPCLDCGEPLAVTMRDEEILAAEPETIAGYSYAEVGGPAENRPWR